VIEKKCSDTKIQNRKENLSTVASIPLATDVALVTPYTHLKSLPPIIE
jgi:hypothetical protein